MLRRLFVRIVRGCVAVAALMLMTGALVSYLALRQPAWYAELRMQTLSAADQAAAKQAIEAAQVAAQRWLEQSLVKQHARLLDVASSPAGTPPSAALYDPQQDVHTVRFTQQQLNAMLAEDGFGFREPLRNPRVRVDHDGIELAIEVAIPSAPAILSAVVGPSSLAGGDLRLDIRSARVGTLALPLETILRCLPRPVVYSNGELHVDLTPPTPHLTLRLSKSDTRSPTIKSIRCLPGELIVELLPPLLEQPPAADAQPLLTRTN